MKIERKTILTIEIEQKELNFINMVLEEWIRSSDEETDYIDEVRAIQRKIKVYEDFL